MRLSVYKCQFYLIVLSNRIEKSIRQRESNQIIFSRIEMLYFPATRHHRPLAGTKLYCLVTEAHVC